MKKALLFAFLVLPALVFGQVINSFDVASPDTNYWYYFDTQYTTGRHFQTNGGATVDKGFLTLTYVTDPLHEGTAALKIDYSVHNTESWGGYTKLEHWNPDPAKAYDWSRYDSLEFWYYNTAPQSLPGRITFRLGLHDCSDSPNGTDTYTVGEVEYYYSFQKILDNAPGWKRFAMSLTADPNFWDGQGFNRTGWAGIQGNDKLDLDKIKGFSIEFSISGAGEGDVSAGTIILDGFTLFHPTKKAFIFFNGKDVAPEMGAAWTWGQSAVEIETGAGPLPGTNAIKWTQGDEWSNGWSGIGWSPVPPYDLTNVWDSDSLKLKCKAEDGVGPIRVQLEDGVAKVGSVFQPVTDGAFHQYTFALKDLAYQDGTSNFNTANVSVVGLMAEASAKAGKVVYFTDMWTGSPVIDVIAPNAVAGLTAFKGTYFNLVTWEDVPGESKEIYNVYASQSPITDVNAPGVTLIGSKIAHGTQSVTHHLVYPLVDTDVTWYYGIICLDDFSNASPLATFGPFTNAAKGIATIALKSPNFVADGDPKEFIDAGVKPFEFKASESHWSLGTFDNDADLSADVYLAMDDQNFYLCFDVIDNVFSYDPTGNWYEDDAIEFFIGLYDLKTVHNGLKRGAEPDYQMHFAMDRAENSSASGNPLYLNNTPNYIFQDFGAQDYIIECKIPLDSLLKGACAGDTRFHPVNGQKIIMDIVIHDSDSKNVRDGSLSFSEIASDNSWQGPQNWGTTWIGDRATVLAVDDRPGDVPVSYTLSQNYPNPFNPTTILAYSIPQSGKVTIDLYNVLGQKVATLVDGVKQAGAYQVEFNAKDLTSGVYFYHIQAGTFSQTRKMVLMR